MAKIGLHEWEERGIDLYFLHIYMVKSGASLYRFMKFNQKPWSTYDIDSIPVNIRCTIFVIAFETRSTPRAQTSAVPSLGNMKQSIQAWNTLANCYLCPYPKISGIISIHMSLHNVAIKEGPKNRKKVSCIQGVTWIILKIFQIVPCVTVNLSWKFHENLPIHFTVMLLTDTLLPRWETVKQSRQPCNSLDNYFLGRPWHFMKLSGKSVLPFFHNITNKHVTSTDPGNGKATLDSSV